MTAELGTADSTSGSGTLRPAAEGGPILGPDGLLRTPWAMGDPLLTHYYDTEWGAPVRTEQGLFERITLEAFQSGLSWLIILRKREAFREAFADFSVDRVAALTEQDVTRLLGNADIVRNRAKILATIGNARATQTLRDGGGLPALIWSFAPDTPLEPRTVHEVPTRSAESVALAAALRSHGFRFVGPTTTFALMEAVGLVDTHLVGSHRRGVATAGVSPQTNNQSPAHEPGRAHT